MPTIVAGQPIFTTVIEFKVPAEAQVGLVNLLKTVGPILKQQKGFISQSIHRSYNNEKVLVYMQWQSYEEEQASEQDPAMQATLKKLAALIEAGRLEMEAYSYEVVHTQEV